MKPISLVGLLWLGALAYGQAVLSSAIVNCILQINPTGTSQTSHNQVFSFGWQHWQASTSFYSLAFFSTSAYSPVVAGYDATRRLIHATSGNEMSLTIVVVPAKDGTFSSFTAGGFVTYNNQVIYINPTDINAYGASCTITADGSARNFNLCHTGAPRC
ncbi:uncharacterized protein L969DRAFT_42973 [Mixia osmundae IAM 14324]|uniref:Uncharacterized protein n=1 Tax=Mixia osmundae (strain CBS 9802 / IAM 14324 / JCM 22182 / KY 12970) TaxID=764103 RepID=G7DZE2_MIXOS|nr:uncharacterized protein L969DRAFT_42973 [Mixia osmundae IAM 14324]KEI42583.1 hypothetical protein L969DRAFT_42973 [Mixia osmundae IAM 14324]GAA95952.1 hypothetical protein E5Q_02610 [Mixia osmundae IAM 14324]